MYRFSKRSLNLLEACESDLKRVAIHALKISPYDFCITETIRTADKQYEYFKEGKSKTLHSRHLPNKNGLSEALDIAVLVGKEVTWNQKFYRPVAQAFFTSAIKEGVQIEWGGLWQEFIDCPHFQIFRG